jgi:hypothetical protein
LEWKDPILKERLFGLTNNQETTEMLKNFIFTKFQRLIPTTNTSINILKTNFLMMIWCQNHRSREETEFELLDTDSLKTMPILIVLSNMQKQVLMIF